MPKSKDAEIVLLDREERIAEFKRMVDQIVDERVREVMGADDAILEPWFQSKQISYEIKRRQTVAEQQKFRLYFEEYGCFVCSRQDVVYHSSGMCGRCFSTRVTRLRAVIRKNAPPADKPAPSFPDTVTMARNALLLPARETWLNQTQAAAAVGISKPTLIGWLRSGKFPHPETKFSPGHWLWTPEDIARLKAFAAERLKNKKADDIARLKKINAEKVKR